MDRAYEHLREHKVEHASSGPQLLPKTIPNAGGIRAFYFKDPDGHPLEILQFPPDKGGREVAHARPTASSSASTTRRSSSADTDASLALLPRRARPPRRRRERELRHRAGAPEQRVRRSAAHHRPASGEQGPGIELLEYLAPRDGRPAPADLRANDLAHWQTRLVIGTPADAAGALRGRAIVSPGKVETPAASSASTGASAVGDPDGHVVQLVTP